MLESTISNLRMKPGLFRILGLLVLLLIFSPKLKATHLAGGDISYQHIGGDTFQIEMNLYWDCGGSLGAPFVGLPTSTATNNVNRQPPTGFGASRHNGTRITSTCGGSVTPGWVLDNPGGTEVSQLCGDSLSSSECSGGSLPGLERYTYIDTVVLSSCANWTVSFVSYARNNSINVLNSGSATMFIKAEINTVTDSTNSTPVFSADPAPYYCQGQQVNYDFQITDPDGDSISAILESALRITGGGNGIVSTMSYIVPYSSAQPIGSSSFNASTGVLTFTPDTGVANAGNFIVVIEVRDYDGSGNVKSKVRRDFQVVVQDCGSNVVPATRSGVNGGVSNVQGGIRLDTLTVEMLEGDSLDFDVEFFDAGDSIYITSNNLLKLSGSNFVTSTARDSAVGTLSWRAGTSSATPRTVTFTAEDDNCPVSGINSVTVRIFVEDSLSCIGYSEVAQSCSENADGTLRARTQGGLGPYGFVWRKNGTIDASLTNRTITGIKSTDSYSVTVIDSFNNTSCALGSKNIAKVNEISVITDSVFVTDTDCDGNCLGEIDIRELLGGTPSSSGTSGYSYAWSSTTDTTNHPDSLCAGRYFVTISDNRSCDTVYRFFVNGPPTFRVSIVDSVDVLCKGDSTGSATVRAKIINSGITTNSCDSLDFDTLGSGTTSNTFSAYPTPYGRRKKIKQQYLYRVSELKAAGLADGDKISEIGFEIALDNFIGSVANFEISIGGTSEDSLSNTQFIPGLFNVFSTASLSIPLGVNDTFLMHSLQNSFVWNGDSNLIVEVCFNNASAGTHIGANVKNTSTSYRSDAVFESDVVDACLQDTVLQSGSRHPNLRFGKCGSEFTYNWTSSSTDSIANDLWAATHSVTVTNEESCADTITVIIDEPARELIASVASRVNVNCAGDTTGSARISVTGGIGALTYSWPAGVSTGVNDSIGINLSSGINYVVTVEDANGCSDTAAFTLTELSNLRVDITDSVSLNCFGDTIGRLFATPDSGSSPYTFSWTNLTGGGTVTTLTGFDSVAIDLSTGNYRVVVTDNIGCTDSVEANLSEPADLITLFSDSSGVACNGDTNASLTVTTTGGTPAYQYFWFRNGGGGVSLGAADSIAINLPADTFAVIIRDANGCRDTLVRVIDEPDALTFSFTDSTSISCAGGIDGSLTVTPSGGRPNYTYAWELGVITGATDSIAVSLSAGTYTVTVTDNNMCTAVDSASLIDPTGISVSFTDSTGVTCNGAATGSLTATPASSTGPYTWAWKDLTGGTTVSTGSSDSIAINLADGTYRVVLTDGSGCIDSADFSLSEPVALNISIVDSTSVLCNGDTNGTLTSAVTGGTLGYLFSWTPAVSNPTADSIGESLTGGVSYEVLVIDANGCRDSISTTLLDPSVVTATFTDSTSVSCNGDNDGSVTITPGGGTPGYTYSWSNATAGTPDSIGTTITGGNLVSVTVTDASLCTAIRTITLQDPVSVTAAFTDSTVISCPGDTNGSLTVTPSGGSAGYTFSWSAGVTTGTSDSIAINLSGGLSYGVLVTDANGCTDSIFTSLSNAAGGLAIAITDSTALACNGDTVGSLTATPSSGSSPYTFSWSNLTSGGGVSTGSSDSIAINLTADTYRVIVEDNNGCQDSVDYVLNEPTQMILSFTDSTSVDCNGNNSGSLTVTPNGGTAGYTFSWPLGVATGASDSIAVSLSGGTSYTVTVQDGNLCPATLSGSLTDPTLLNASFTDSISVSCIGGTNGQVTITPSGGTPGYTYAWTNATAGTPDSIGTGVTGGNLVTVTVTDANLCTAIRTITLQDPAGLGTIVTDSTVLSCAGDSTASLTVTPQAGAQPFTFVWIPAVTTGSSDSIATGLTSGVLYKVVVTDGNGCKDSVLRTLTAPSAVIAQIFDSTSILCLGDTNGVLFGRGVSGTSPYNYAWKVVGSAAVVDTGSSDSIAVNLGDGNYRLIVTDNNGCQDSTEKALVDPLALTAAFTDSTVLTCSGPSNNGSLTVTPTGGTSGYSFAWGPGTITTGASDSIAVSLSASILYRVTVTDANLCSVVVSDSLTDPSNFSAAFSSVTQPLCNNDSTGQLIVTPNTGTPPFTFTWNLGTAGTSDSIRTNLPGGVTIFVTVTDNGSCSDTISTSLTNPLALNSVFTDSTSVNCNGDTTGSLTITPFNGTQPYSFTWVPAVSAGASDSIAINLAGNTQYVVQIQDGNGCIANDTASLFEPNAFSIAFTDSTSLQCNGDTVGSVTITPSGGTPGYTYNWLSSLGTTVSTSPDSVAINIPSAEYFVTVTDLVGCTESDSINLTEPTAITATVDTFNSTCGINDGIAVVNPSGGTSGYTFAWDSAGTALGVTSDTITGLFAGFYQVVVTDTNGCTADFAANISDQGAPIIILDSLANASCDNVCNGAILLSVTSFNGTVGYSWSNSDTTEDISNLCDGVYNLIATDTAGCSATFTDTIVNIDTLETLMSSSPLTCGFTVCDGEVKVLASGVTMPYTYQWSTAVTDTIDSVIGLCAGTYTVTVTGTNGCLGIDSVTISNPANFTLTSSSDSVSCNSGTDGVARVDLITGGAGPFSYAWSTSLTDTIDSVSGLGFGQYFVTVTASDGCSEIDTINISEPDTISSSFAVIDADCAVSNGRVTASPSGGNGVYSYLWPVGGATTNALDTGYAAGIYNVTITDQKSCSNILGFTINNNGAPTVTLDSIRNESCPGACDGGIFISVTGGLPTYLYQWTPGLSTGQDLDSVCPGIHQVRVTDQNSCIVFYSDTIDPADTLQISATFISNASSTSICDGQASVSVISGGIAPIGFAWTSGNSSSTANDLCVGMNYVTVTDFAGCQAIDSILISAPVSIVLDSSNVTDNTCGATPCNGQVFVQASGGSGTLTYAWDNGDIGQLTTVRCAGFAFVTVTDILGDSAVFSLNVTDIGGPNITKLKSDISCFGECDGLATVSTGFGAFTFLWPFNGSKNDTIDSLCMGSYEVRVTQTSTGCTTSDTINIQEPSQISSTFLPTEANCGANDGQLIAVVTGGTGSYNYSWLDNSLVPLVPAQTTDTASSISSGLYNVSVTDANLCSVVIPTTLNDVTGPSLSLDSLNDISCFGSCDGGIFVTTSGAGTLTYSWTGGTSSEDLTNACAGIYILEVTDTAGCKTFLQDTINDAQQILTSITIVGTPSNTSTCDGEANIAVTSGGTPPFTFSWSSGAAGPSATNLCTGVNFVTTTDFNGCAIIDTFNLNLGNVIVLDSALRTNPNCNSCNGRIDVFVSGGTAPYTYLWDNGDNADSTTGRCAGVVEVTVTDNAGLTESFTFTLSDLPSPNFALNGTDVSCFGESDGKAFVTVLSGTPPITVTWVGILATGDTASNLSAGIYGVEVSDIFGCTAVDTIEIDEPTQIQASFTLQDALCGASDGSIIAQITTPGGFTPYNYQWLDKDSIALTPPQTSDTLNNVSSGVYFLSVTDNISCTALFNANVSDIGGPSVSLDSLNNESCQGDCDGAINLTTSGTGTLTYNWLPGSLSSEDISNLCSGNYIVSVTDGLGCVSIQSFDVLPADSFDLSLVRTTNASCESTFDGALDLNIFGNASGFNYTWTGPSGFTASVLDLNGISVGDYDLVVTDQTGCQDSVSASIGFNTSIDVVAAGDTFLCSTSSSIFVSALATSNATVSYTWFDDLGFILGNLPIIQVTPKEGVTQFVVEASAGLCLAFDTVEVTYSGFVRADAGPDREITKGDEIEIGGNPTSLLGDSIFWSPSTGILTSTEESNPLVGPENTTIYEVLVKDPFGCFALDSVLVTVNPPEINDGFSPNGDGVNDGWQLPIAEDYPDILVDIYNRWGQLVFSSVGYTVPWDGRYKGQDLPVGTYYYVIDLNDNTVEDRFLSGPITIMR